MLGRVLNPVASGYAVGIGGYVALLRYNQASKEVSKIGTLQPFYIHSMWRERGGRAVIELTCYVPNKGGGEAGGGVEPGLYANAYYSDGPQQ